VYLNEIQPQLKSPGRGMILWQLVFLIVSLYSLKLKHINSRRFNLYSFEIGYS
jgi:hypothetical protein